MGSTVGEARRAPLAPTDNQLDLQIIVDGMAMALFAQGGLLSMTELIFPGAPLATVGVDVVDGSATLTTCQATKLVGKALSRHISSM